ncbi:MAG: hypothetical protein Kow0042_05140 [Calditrichia bacterium]
MEEKQEMNVGSTERKISIIGGGALLLYALKHFSWKSIFPALGGVFLLHRGLSGRCPIYDALEIPPVEEAVSRTKPAVTPLESETQTPAVKEPRSKPAAKRLNYSRWSYDALYEKAKALNLPGRSKMNKAQLIKALQDATVSGD